MPNNGRITLCPYYRNERALTVTCEDCVRRFRYLGQKKKWMDTYCDKDWKDCPYAAELDAIYQEGGNLVEHELDAVKKELRKTVKMLERRIRSDEAKAEDIKKLRRKNKVMEDRINELIKKDIRHRAKEKKAFDQIQSLTQMYEARFAYLMDVCNNGELNEDHVKAWSEGKEFAIVAEERNERGEVCLWKVKVRDENRRSKSNDAEASADAAGKRETKG